MEHSGPFFFFFNIPDLTFSQRRRYQIGEFESENWHMSWPASSSFLSHGTHLPSKQHIFCSAPPCGFVRWVPVESLSQPNCAED